MIKNAEPLNLNKIKKEIRVIKTHKNEENNKLEESDSENEDKEMIIKRKRSSKKFKRPTGCRSEPFFSFKSRYAFDPNICKRIGDMTIEQRNATKRALERGKYLPFYKSSGTSVFTSRIPPDFKDLYFCPPEFKLYLPNFPSSSSRKKTKGKR